MKQYKFFLRLLIIISCLIQFAASAQSNSFFVKLNDRATKDISILDEFDFIKDYECPFVHSKMQSVFVVTTDQIITVQDFIVNLKGMLKFDYIEEVPKYELFYTPNDLNASQWNLTQISAELAWDINSDASSVKIAIIDDAVELMHPDLAANIWFNSGEIPGNGIDDDANGWIDDVSGWDFGDNDNNPNPISASFDHGSHVAGIASAVTDNSMGIAAIGGNAQLIPIKISEDATGSLTGGYIGIDYAIAIGADVINMSWGGGVQSVTYQTLFDLAYANGIVCVAAAGNSNTSAPMYPASYNHVISVGATTPADQRTVFSNYGPTLDVSAPGLDIYSVLSGSPLLYGNKSGTSMAAPLVAGLVALMIDANPLATVDEIINCLTTTCDPVVGALANQMGAGRINAFEALKCITNPTAQFTSNLTQVCPGNAIEFYYSSGAGVTWNWSFPGGTPATSTLQNPIIVYNTAGVYDVTLTVSNGITSQTNTISGYVIVTEPTATISGLSTIIAGGMGSVIVNFSGTPPYDIVITDGTMSYPFTGITTSPYVQFFSPITNTDYSLISFNDSQCSGTTVGLATINVTPSTGTICDTVNTSMIKYLGTNVKDQAHGVADLGSLGYLVWGRKEISSTSFRAYICRLDNCGNVLWENIYDPNNTFGLPIAGHLDGNELLICCYQGSSTSTKTLLLRLDLNGVVLDSRIIAGPSFSTYPRYMDKLVSGDYVIGCVTNATMPSLGTNDLYAVKIQPNGTVLWQTRLGGGSNEFLHDITEAESGNILITGFFRDYTPGLESGLLSKLDASGNHLWTKRYDLGVGKVHFASSIEYNGFYYTVGDTDQGTSGSSDGVLMKTDVNGSIIWVKKIGGSGYEVVYAVAAHNDTLLVEAISNSGAPSREVVLAKFDLAGNLIDYASFGTANDELMSGNGKNLITNSQGDFIGVASGDGGVLGNMDIMFFKLGDYQDICQPSTSVIQATNVPIVANTFAAGILTPAWSFTPIAILIEPVVSNQGYACSDIVYIDSIICNITANFSMAPGYCYGDSIDFTDLSTPNDTITTNYWDFGDNTTTGFVPNGDYSHVFPGPGNYTVQLIALDTLTGCADTVSQLVTITANPYVDFPDTIVGCLFDTVDIDVISYCLSNQAVIDWHPYSLVVSENYLSATVVIAGAGYVYVSITDNGIIVEDSIYLAIGANCCTSVPIIEAATGIFCEIGAINVTQNSITNGSPTFNWSFLPDGIPLTFNGATPPTITFATTGAKQIILNLTDNCGTRNDTLEIYIFDPPQFDAGADAIFCEQVTVNLGEDPISDWNYDWSPANAVSDPTISNPTAMVDASETIYVTVTDIWTGCSYLDSVTFIFDSVYVDILMSDTTICSVTGLMVPAEFYGTNTINWGPTNAILQTFPSSAQVNIDQSMTVTATISGDYGCTSTDQVSISLVPATITLYIDTTVCEENGFVYYPSGIWYEIGGSTSLNVININDAGIYYYVEQDTCGMITHEIHVSLEQCACNVYIPNAFTPDGDTYNNVFIPVGDCEFESYEFRIFNRWGEIIFETNNPLKAWDGTYLDRVVQDGVYTWTLKYDDVYEGKEKLLNGHVSVLR